MHCVWSSYQGHFLSLSALSSRGIFVRIALLQLLFSLRPLVKALDIFLDSGDPLPTTMSLFLGSGWVTTITTKILRVLCFFLVFVLRLNSRYGLGRLISQMKIKLLKVWSKRICNVVSMQRSAQPIFHFVLLINHT